MVDVELTRTSRDRRLYELADVGSLRLEGLFSRSATAEADGRRWRFVRRGVLRVVAVATDESGAEAGNFEPRGFRRGGTVHWAGRELLLRPASNWRERYALVDGEHELALLDGKGWGRRPVKITLAEPSHVAAALLLFAAFVVRGLAADAQSAAAGGASAAATG
jgi:hypothetical protein